MNLRLAHPSSLPRALWLGVCLMNVIVSPALAEPKHWPGEHRVGRFFFHADFAIKSNSELVRQTTQLQTDIDRVLGARTSIQPIHIFVFRRRATYDGYLKHYLPGLPQRRALFVKGRGPGMVFAHESPHLEKDIRHEVSHAVLNSALGPLPLWLDEGLAEYFEVPREHRRLPKSSWNQLRQRLLSAGVPSMRRLESLRQTSQMSKSDYLDAWAWAHFLLHGPRPAREALREFLDARRAGHDVRLSRILASRLTNADAAFRAHFLGPRAN